MGHLDARFRSRNRTQVGHLLCWPLSSSLYRVSIFVLMLLGRPLLSRPCLHYQDLRVRICGLRSRPDPFLFGRRLRDLGRLGVKRQ